MGNDGDSYLAAVRWSMQGSHRGNGIYGQPTGRPVMLWGISQQHIVAGLIQAEWTLFNEFALIRQIFRD